MLQINLRNSLRDTAYTFILSTKFPPSLTILSSFKPGKYVFFYCTKIAPSPSKLFDIKSKALKESLSGRLRMYFLKDVKSL